MLGLPEPWQMPLFQEVRTPRGTQYYLGLTIRAHEFVVPTRCSDTGATLLEYYHSRNGLSIWELDRVEKHTSIPRYHEEEPTCPCCGK